MNNRVKRCGAGAGGSKHLDDSTIVRQRRRVYACAATTTHDSLSQIHQPSVHQQHPSARWQIQYIPQARTTNAASSLSVGHGRNGRARGWACDTYSRSSPGRRGVHRSRRLGYRPPCPEPACLRRTDRWQKASCTARRRLPWRRRALLAATVCVRRWRGDRPLRNSPSVTSALQAVAMPTMASCASAMIGES